MKVGMMRIEDKVALLLSRNPTITLRLGDRFVNIIVDKELHRLSLKFNGCAEPLLMDYKTTYQYRTLTALGYKTRDGQTYNYCDGEHDIWVRLWKSKIQAIKDNLDIVSWVSYQPKTEVQ